MRKIRLAATATCMLMLLALLTDRAEFSDPSSIGLVAAQPEPESLPPRNDSIDHQIDRGGMHFTISLPQTLYASNDRIPIQLEAINTTNTDIERYMNCYYDFQYIIRSESSDFGLLDTFSSDLLNNRIPGAHPGACTKPIDTLIPIKPGEEVAERIVFLPRVGTYADDMLSMQEEPAPSGEYTIEIYMIGSEERMLVDRFSVRIDTEIPPGEQHQLLPS